MGAIPKIKTSDLEQSHQTVLNSEPTETSKMDLFRKIPHHWCWLGCECVSALS